MFSLSSSAEELFITRMAARLSPERQLTVTADEAGEVEVCWRGAGRAEKGVLLARVNPEMLELEEAELELQVSRVQLESEKEMLQLTRQREEMQFIASLPPQKRLYVEPHMGTKADDRALALLESRMELLREQARLNEQKLREAFAKKKALRHIRMPFRGRVQFHATLPPEGERLSVISGAPIVTMADDSALYVALVPADPALVRLETARLSLRLETGDGKYLRAAWSHKRIEKNGQMEALVYYFRVPEEEGERVWALMGSNLIAELWYNGEPDWLYEEKTSLAREAGERPFETWEELLASLRPGYVLVFSGETHLCLKPQEDREQP